MNSNTEPAAEQPRHDERLLSEWMTLEELAAELGVHKETVRTWNRERRGPPFARVGLRRLYRREAVREWLRQQEVRS